MKFEYRSLRTGEKKELPEDVVKEMREHIKLENIKSLGELQDAMLEFKGSDGEGLLIHQLEPMFTYVAVFGELWPEE